MVTSMGKSSAIKVKPLQERWHHQSSSVLRGLVERIWTELALMTFSDDEIRPVVVNPDRSVFPG